MENTVEREDDARSMTRVFLGEGLSNRYSSNSITERGMPSLARNGCQEKTAKVREPNANLLGCQSFGLRTHTVFILRGLLNSRLSEESEERKSESEERKGA